MNYETASLFSCIKTDFDALCAFPVSHGKEPLHFSEARRRAANGKEELKEKAHAQDENQTCRRKAV